jgi:hypothetical protein
MININGTNPVRFELKGSDPDKGDKFTFSIVKRPLNALVSNFSDNLLTYTPSDGSHFVPIDSKITATLSEPVSVEANSFMLKDTKNIPIPGTISLGQDGKTLEFKPSTKLDSSTTYIATITGVKDLAGNTMSTPRTWKFTTA